MWTSKYQLFIYKIKKKWNETEIGMVWHVNEMMNSYLYFFKNNIKSTYIIDIYLFTRNYRIIIMKDRKMCINIYRYKFNIKSNYNNNNDNDNISTKSNQTNIKKKKIFDWRLFLFIYLI